MRTEVQGSVSKDWMGDQGGGFACAPLILVKMVIQRTQRRSQNHRNTLRFVNLLPGKI